jgi:hypothetical protein
MEEPPQFGKPCETPVGFLGVKSMRGNFSVVSEQYLVNIENAYHEIYVWKDRSHSTRPKRTVRMHTSSLEDPFPKLARDKTKHGRPDCHKERREFAYQLIRDDSNSSEK